MNKLIKYKLSDLYEMGSGISTSPNQAGHGYPFVSFSSIFNNCILPDELPDLMDTSQSERIKYSVKEGDVLLTRTSETLDELAMSSVAIKDYPDATFSGFAKRLRPKNTGLVYPKFMAYFLRSPYFRRIIDCKAVMTLRASFNEEIFSYIKLELPEYNEQVKIGDLFWNIESKVRTNKKIIDKLEKNMRLVFEHWFLQYDFGKKPYKKSGGLMEWNPIIKDNIPSGWSVDSLGNVANLYQPEMLSEEDLIDNGEYSVYGAGGYIGRYNKYNHEDYEVIISCRGNCGQKAITLPMSWITSNAMVVNPKKEFYYKEYLYQYLDYVRIEPCISGSVQRQITRTNLETLPVIIPKKELLDEYNNLVLPMREKIIQLTQEINKLESTRNYLLPLFISGQARID